MDKSTSTFAVVTFQALAPLVPNLKTLGKCLNDLGKKLPKSIQEEVKFDDYVKAFDSFVKNESGSKNPLSDARAYFTKWVKETVASVVEKADESLFEKRGRSTKNVLVKLFGKEETVPQSAMSLIAGSKLHEVISNGPGEGFGNWKDLNMVFNALAKALKESIPADERPKRKARTAK